MDVGRQVAVRPNLLLEDNWWAGRSETFKQIRSKHSLGEPHNEWMTSTRVLAIPSPTEQRNALHLMNKRVVLKANAYDMICNFVVNVPRRWPSSVRSCSAPRETIGES